MRNVIFKISLVLLFIQCESKRIVSSQFIDLLISGDSEDGELPNLYGNYELFSKVEDSVYLATNVNELKRIYLFKKVEEPFKDYLGDILNQRILFPSEFIADDHYLFHLDQTIMDMELEELEERFSITKEDNKHFYYFPDSRDNMGSHLSLLYMFYKNDFTVSMDCEIGSYGFVKEY